MQGLAVQSEASVGLDSFEWRWRKRDTLNTLISECQAKMRRSGLRFSATVLFAGMKWRTTTDGTRPCT